MALTCYYIYYIEHLGVILFIPCAQPGWCHYSNVFGALFNSVLVCYFVDKPLLTCTIINIHRWISLEGPFAYWTVNVKYDVSSSLSVTNVINGQFWWSREYDVSNPDLPSMAECDTSNVTVCTVNQVQCITGHAFMYMIAMSQVRLRKIIYNNTFLHMIIYFTLWLITGTVNTLFLNIEEIWIYSYFNTGKSMCICFLYIYFFTYVHHRKSSVSPTVLTLHYMNIKLVTQCITKGHTLGMFNNTMSRVWHGKSPLSCCPGMLMFRWISLVTF